MMIIQLIECGFHTILHLVIVTIGDELQCALNNVDYFSVTNSVNLMTIQLENLNGVGLNVYID